MTAISAPDCLTLLGTEPAASWEQNLSPAYGETIGSGSACAAGSEGDDKWLEFVRQRQWIVFSQDRKFHIPGFEHEMLAIKQFNVGCFYLWGANARTHEKALVFLKAYDRILKAIETTPRPFIYDITKFGKLEKIPIT